jgi:hypothetical protein
MRRNHALGLALLATMSFSACGGGDGDGDQNTSAQDTSSTAPSPSPSAAPDNQDAGPAEGTPIRITFGDTELTGRLADNATARALVAQLPLTLSFRDHNNVEKTASLPRELSVEGAPAGHDPAAGEIGYWAPGGDLVFYYDDGAPRFDGIVRVGEFDGNVGALERQSEAFDVTVDRAR